MSSILTIPYLRFFPKWFNNLITPKVRSSNLLVEYSHAQADVKEKTITIEYLDDNNDVVTSEILIDNLQGNSHKIETSPLSKFRIKVENTSNVTLNFTLKLTYFRIGSVKEFDLTGISSGAAKYSKTYNVINSDFDYKKAFRVNELLTINTGNTFTSDAKTLKNDITSLLVDEKDNIYVGRIANGTYADSLEKYNSDGDFIWGKKAIQNTISTGTIVNMVKDSDNYIYTIDSLGSVAKNDSSGSDADWRVSFGQPCTDIKIDNNGDIYVSGGNTLKKFDSDGVVIWTYTFAGSGITGVSLDNGYVYICTKFTNNVIKLNQSLANDSTPPTVEWTETLAYATSYIEIQNGNVYVTTSTGTKSIYYIGALTDTGITFTSFSLESGEYGRILSDNFQGHYIITRGTSNEIRRYNSANEIVWKKPLKNTGTSLGIAIVKDDNGKIIYSSWGTITKINPDEQLTGYINK